MKVPEYWSNVLMECWSVGVLGRCRTGHIKPGLESHYSNTPSLRHFFLSFLASFLVISCFLFPGKIPEQTQEGGGIEPERIIEEVEARIETGRALNRRQIPPGSSDISVTAILQRTSVKPLGTGVDVPPVVDGDHKPPRRAGNEVVASKV